MTASPMVAERPKLITEAGSALWPSLIVPSQRHRDELCVTRCHGVRREFADGTSALCATSGLWNVPLGYGNEVIAEACHRAAREMSYAATFRFANAPARQAADALVNLLGADKYARVLFSSAGGAANDLVMKVARHAQYLRGQTQRRLVVGLRGSYHGMMFGSAAVTGEDLNQQLYGVDQRLVRHVEPNDVEGLTRFMERWGGSVAAVIVEPVLGTGTIPLEEDFLEALVVARQRHDFLLVADEVATGFGRTGPMFASQLWPVPPDVVVLSKALTNGLCAASAVVVSHDVARLYEDADQFVVHAETQAGTALATSAILATLAEMERLDVLSFPCS